MLLMLLLAILIIFWVYFTAILWPLAMFHHFWTAFYDPLKYECFIGTITLFSALYTPFVHWKKRRSYDERTYGIFFLLPRDLEISVLFFLLSSSGCAPCMHAALVRTAVRSFAARLAVATDSILYVVRPSWHCQLSIWPDISTCTVRLCVAVSNSHHTAISAKNYSHFKRLKRNAILVLILGFLYFFRR